MAGGGHALASWLRRRQGPLLYRRVLVRITGQDKTVGLLWFNFLIRRDIEGSSGCGGYQAVTENETPLLRYSIYFYDRTTYIVITAEPQHETSIRIRKRISNPA